MTTDNITLLREYLALYGSELRTWPDAARHFWAGARRHPECAALMEAERRFERLLADRQLQLPEGGLAERIILAAQPRPPEASWATAQQRPAAIAACLALGFLLGFGVLSSTPSPLPPSQQTLSVALADDMGTLR